LQLYLNKQIRNRVFSDKESAEVKARI